MRNSKKVLAMLLALAMTLGMTATAFAEDSNANSEGETTPISDTADPAEGEDEKDKADEDADADAEDKKDGEADADAEDKKDGEADTDAEDKKDGEADADAEDKKDDEADADAEDKKDDEAAPVAMAYTDFTEQNWYYGAVSFVTEKKLMDGLTETTFGPSEKMTRQMLAVALYRLAGSPEVTAENPFTDVADDAAYKDAVVWAYSVGVVTGVTETTFNPDSTVQRQAIAAMLARYLNAETTGGADLSAFTDADAIQNYAKDALSWAVANELIQGNANGTIDPRGDATRAQVATILQRFAPMAEGKAPAAAPAADDAATPADDAAAPAEDTKPADDATAPAEGDNAGDEANEPAEGGNAGDEANEPAEGDNAGDEANEPAAGSTDTDKE